MATRLSQISGHLTNSAGRGLIADEVVIITGEFVCSSQFPSINLIRVALKVLLRQVFQYVMVLVTNIHIYLGDRTELRPSLC